MPRYTITESVGRRVERVSRFEDLEKHHPSSGREPGRDYATIEGRLEEVRLQNGRTFVKKDFILSQDMPGPVYIPAPASGYVHHLNDSTNAIRLYDRPFGTPGAVMLAQSLHMTRGTSPPPGTFIEYGAPLGQMGDTGSPGSVHAHVELEAAQFRRYIRDIVDGTIQPDVASGVTKHPPRERASPLASAGTEESSMSTGRRDAANPVAAPPLQRPDSTSSSSMPLRSAGDYGPTPLSDLIGNGEGSYGAYNRGRAGDSGGREVDFSQMTVGEVMRRQELPRSNPDALFAVGKFQMIPSTLRETVEALGVDRNARFTPQLQERMFADYLIDEKRPAVQAYITGRSGGGPGLERAQIALAQEFASVADPRTGRSYYEGDRAGNSASITSAAVVGALDTMRQRYQAGLDRGLSPDAAYRALAHSAQGYGSLGDELMRQGARGDAVRALQEQLNRLGARDAHGRALEPDSDFGRRTAEAVSDFQLSRGLEPDGVVGSKTLNALREAISEREQSSPATLPAPAAASGSEKPQSLEASTGFVERLLAAARRNDARAIADATQEMLGSQMGIAWQNEGRCLLTSGEPHPGQPVGQEPGLGDVSR